ncbi:MAG: hypothetical protein KatS3mg023_0474 [Armatimonadota bacterium]|nr:MAG: hypothetical protein KatS3mg023_0474 [Armatimonadota bacterium]
MEPLQSFPDINRWLQDLYAKELMERLRAQDLLQMMAHALAEAQRRRAVSPQKAVNPQKSVASSIEIAFTADPNMDLPIKLPKELSLEFPKDFVNDETQRALRGVADWTRWSPIYNMPRDLLEYRQAQERAGLYPTDAQRAFLLKLAARIAPRYGLTPEQFVRKERERYAVAIRTGVRYISNDESFNKQVQEWTKAMLQSSRQLNKKDEQGKR